MRRLLVTGGAGFIGANFVHYWLRQHARDEVVVLDSLTYAGNPANLDGLRTRSQFRFVHGDICDEALVESLLREEGVDVIVHFAAESHVDRSIVGPDAFIHTNVLGTHCLLKAARKVWLVEKSVPVHRFHHVSTDEVYGSLAADDPAFTEETPYAPNSPYSASKAASDHLVRAYVHTYGLNATTSNCSNNYGPYQFPEKLIPLMILNALRGEPLPVYGDGRHVRDWLHVDDHCRGVELVILAGRTGETYNIGGACERANIDVVERICGLIDAQFRRTPRLAERFPHAPAANGCPTRSLVTFVPDRPGHDWRYAIDSGKAARELGYRPTHSFEEGLEETVRWFVENEDWWAAILNGEHRRSIARQFGTTVRAGAPRGLAKVQQSAAG